MKTILAIILVLASKSWAHNAKQYPVFSICLASIYVSQSGQDLGVFGINPAPDAYNVNQIYLDANRRNCFSSSKLVRSYLINKVCPYNKGKLYRSQITFYHQLKPGGSYTADYQDRSFVSPVICQ